MEMLTISTTCLYPCTIDHNTISSLACVIIMRMRNEESHLS